jgi:hypothetical protein
MAVPLMLAYEELTGLPLRGPMTKPKPFEVDRVFAAGFATGSARYYSLTDRLCRGRQCVTQERGTPVWFDRDHFTDAGASLALRDLTLD